jgi:aminodeoxyfutalosine synthase
MTVSDVELATLATTHDIINLGMLADGERRRRHGTRTTFVRVVQMSADPAELPGAPLRLPAAAGELRIEGAPSSRAQVLERVQEAADIAGPVPLSGYSLADLEQLAAREKVTLRALLEDCRAAGLELVAEAPVDLLQSARRAIEEVNIAGMTVGRLTVHRLQDPNMIALFKSVVELQRQVGVVRAFAPLPRTMNPALPTTGYDDVKRIALARLVVDNVPSIQVDWSLYGPKLAQVALTVGADDVDSVSAEDDMSEGRRRAPLEEIRRNILAAGQDPVERNGRFDLVSS